MKPLRGEYDLERNAYIVGGEPAIFHCHHYNCFLQAVILDTKEYLPEVDLIATQSAQEIAFSQFSAYFKVNNSSIENRKAIVEDYFRFSGFGILDLSKLTENGGQVNCSKDHYGIGWKSKFGISKHPVSFFTAGFIAGACEAIFDLRLGTLNGNQDKCLAMGDDLSRFNISAGDSSLNYIESQGEGTIQYHSLRQPDHSKVDYDAIRNALINMPIEGSAETGLIDAFGVLLTRHYANYYCNISYAFLNSFKALMGDDGVSTATKLMIEAGHVCAFHTFGGVMQSNEWNAMIKPMLNNDDEWVHGIIAVVNSFGWGFWEIDEFVPNKKLRLKVYSGYESNSYLKRYKMASSPISFLATGGTAGIMNLIYVLKLPSKAPLTLDDAVYKQIHMDTGAFTATQLKCRAMGDEYDLFEAILK